MVAWWAASFAISSFSGTGVRPAMRVMMTVWETSGRVYSAFKAAAAAQKELDEVKKQIQQEKEEAIRDIRRQVAVLSVDIAEKIIRKNLDEKHEQMEMIDRMLDEVLAASKNN